MKNGTKEVRARRASDAPLRHKSLKLLELYRATPAEIQSQPHIALMIARLEVVVSDGPVLQLVRDTPLRPFEHAEQNRRAAG